MQIHELNLFGGMPGSTDFLAIDNGFDTSKIPASKILDSKINRPVDGNNQYVDGNPGQLLRTNGDGSTEWVDEGLPSDAQTAQAISDWLNAHPEATTTVLDGSITEAKLNSALALKVIKDYVTPEMFGAVGDGTTDDTQAFIDMFAEKKSVILGGGKTYYIASALQTINDVYMNLNGATIKSHVTIPLGDNCIVFNGTIMSYANTAFSEPTVAIIGRNNTVDHIRFTSNIIGSNYVFTRKNSDMAVISNCHFDGHSKIGINVGGSRAVIENCYFDDVLDNTLYSNCIKFSADDSADLVTPCSRDTTVRNCYFGFAGDNCLDFFSGADGALIDSCVFNNGANVAMEIKSQWRDPNGPDAWIGYSVVGLRITRNIKVTNCTFLGTNYIAVVTTGIEAGYSGALEWTNNVTIKDCIAKNLDGIPFAISAETKNIVFDNIQCPALTANRYLALYGQDNAFLNMDNEFFIVNVHGDYLIQNCKVKQIGIVNSNSNHVEIVGCSTYITGTHFITFTYGKEVIIRDCIALHGSYLVGLSGAPTRMVLKNNIVSILMNNGYGSAGGKVYLVNNLYANYIAPAQTGIELNEGNYKL